MREVKSLPFEIKELADDGSTFSGLAACFNNIDQGRDIIHPKAFDRAIGPFLGKGCICFNHDWNRPIGKPLDAKITERGLYIKARISDTQDGRDTRTLMKDGVIQGLSIGYGVARGGAQFLEKGSDVEEYWRSIRYNPTEDDWQAKGDQDEPVRLLKEIFPLYETSPVPFPMNTSAGIDHVKSGARAALPFDEHSEAVLAAVEEFKARAEALREMRARNGQRLNPLRLAHLKRLADDLAALHALAAEEPAVDDAEVLRLLTDFEQITARLVGVAV